MIDRRRPSHLILTLKPGERRENVPAHLDVLVGAARTADVIDRGAIDRTLRAFGGAFRASAVFHARKSLGRVGFRSRYYNDIEEELGLARTYRLELADSDGARQAVDALRPHPQIESVTLERLATAPATVATARPVPDRETIESPHRMVRAVEALAREPGDERVTVAVVDTGVALGHSEFQRKLLSGYDSVELGLGRINETTTLIGDSHGSDFSPSDDVGHGSHVAGVIGAQGWQVPPGVGGRCLILPIRVLAGAQTPGEPGVCGVGAIGDINAGLKVALDLGADVLNMSFGTPASALDPYDPSPHAAVLEYGARLACVMVAAAGNSGEREVFHPAADAHVIAVGSIDGGGARSEFSTYGDHIAICAPGEDIVSVGRRGYRQSTGTSHATPFVSGAAALLLARARARGITLDADDVRTALTASARPSPSPTDEVGSGVLDIVAALDAFDREHTSTSTHVDHYEGARHGH